MSFVLEALKKQEAGGDPDAAVSLARATRQQRRQRLWIGLFFVAMVANGALLAWIFLGPQTPPADVGKAAAIAQSRDVTPAAPPQAPGRDSDYPPPVSEPTPTESSSSAPASAPAAQRPPPSEQAPPAPARPTRLTLSELPGPARARFPGIAFSTHVYAEDTDLRAVVANGRRLTEGERVRGLEVVEITETGVVLAFERYLVEVPIVIDWDAL